MDSQLLLSCAGKRLKPAGIIMPELDEYCDRLYAKIQDGSLHSVFRFPVGHVEASAAKLELFPGEGAAWTERPEGQLPGGGIISQT
ncbi:hypothetical protein D3C75_1159100 [compost metagenome]